MHLLLALLVTCPPSAAATGAATTVAEAAPPTGAAFLPNHGQWEEPSLFAVRYGSLLAHLEPEALVLGAGSGAASELVRLTFLASSGAGSVVGEGLQPGVHHFLTCPDPAGWRRDVPGYDSVLYSDLYAGIDLRLRDGGGRLEYDLLLEPGADLGAVRVECSGVDALEVLEDGTLALRTPGGTLTQSPPRTWAVTDAGDVPLECRFVVYPGAQYGFQLDAAPEGLPVVVDPVLEFSTLLGGGGDERPFGLVRRSDGSFVQAGHTTSLDLPATAGAYDTMHAGSFDAYVACLDPTGSTLLWATYLSGTEPWANDTVLGLDVAPTGEVFLVGSTQSPTLPTTPDALDASFGGGGWDGFVAQLSSDGSSLQYCSYLGGASGDWPNQVRLVQGREVVVAGTTGSADFPTTAGALQPVSLGGLDYFVARLDLDVAPASQLTYSSYVGGSLDEGNAAVGADLGSFDFLVGLDIQLEDADRVVLAGKTASADFPVTADAWSPAKAADFDVCLAVVDTSASGPAGLTYGTFVGGLGLDQCWALDVGDDGTYTVGGSTDSADFPTTAGAYARTYLGPATTFDAFVLQLDRFAPPADQLVYGTLLPAAGTWEITIDLDVQPDGRVLAVGLTGLAGPGTFSTFPTTCGAYSETAGGDTDGFVVYLDPRGHGASDLLYSTFFGGELFDVLNYMTVVPGAPVPTVVATGPTNSAGFPTTAGAWQGTLAGGQDATLVRLALAAHRTCIAAPNSHSPDGALMCPTGSIAVSDDDFGVSVSGAVPGQPGLFYFGPAMIEQPFGDGYRCVGGNTHRLDPPLVADGTGYAARAVDLGTSPGDLLTAGSAWGFQFWYRDPAAAASGFNLSGGLRVLFQP